MSLLEELTEKDRSIMNNYISRYGAGDHFIGLDEWLKYWDHSKRRLFKLLGNQLIYKIPYTYDKSEKILHYEIENELFSMTFKRIYHWFYIDYVKKLQESNKIDKETATAFSSITNIKNFIDDKIYKGIKFKKADSRKMLQIQKGMKPIRALQKIMEYFPEEFQKVVENRFSPEEEDADIKYEKEFEKFRLFHSMIFNDKKIKGNLCISIHPMDFMTMSDNASDWSSCMSWIEDGCYKIGSVEMMNSNNVLCCYLESSKPFTFENDSETYEWNNKKWRTLVYFTNDIIMSGKAYPYANDDISKELISIIRTLAEKNLNRRYAFGPEPYKDMIHINGLYEMQQNYIWLNEQDNLKHNIIWDTKGMYNDMLNDSKTTYWCYRNKVKHKKIYNVSGKAPCLCCGDTVIEYDEDEDSDYNDRYSNVGTTICYSCEQEFSCSRCRNFIAKGKLYTINGRGEKYCEECFNRYIKRCPECGRPMDINNLSSIGYYKNKNASFKHPKTIGILEIAEEFYSKEEIERLFETVYVCKDCEEIVRNKFAHTQNELGMMWNYKHTVFYPNEDFEKYRYINLESVDPDTDEEILS